MKPFFLGLYLCDLWFGPPQIKDLRYAYGMPMTKRNHAIAFQAASEWHVNHLTGHNAVACAVLFLINDCL